jgi:hypothetical protein
VPKGAADKSRNFRGERGWKGQQNLCLQARHHDWNELGWLLGRVSKEAKKIMMPWVGVYMGMFLCVKIRTNRADFKGFDSFRKHSRHGLMEGGEVVLEGGPHLSLWEEGKIICHWIILTKLTNGREPSVTFWKPEWGCGFSLMDRLAWPFDQLASFVGLIFFLLLLF